MSIESIDNNNKINLHKGKNYENSENLKNLINYRDSLNDLFERDNLPSNNKNNFNNNEENLSNNKNTEKISFNYDYPLSMEKIIRSNTVNREAPKTKNILYENNCDLKNSQNNSNQFKSIPRQLSQQNYNKNPEKELTYWESISKDIKEQDKYDMNLMKKSQLKKEDKTPNNLTNRNFINNNYNNCKFIFLIF